MVDKVQNTAWHGRVRKLNVPDKGAKRAILDAAEAIIASSGFEAVSLRNVTGAAKVNIAAINYHFGSRDGLLELAMTHVLEPLWGNRLALLDVLGKKPSIRDVLTQFVQALSFTAQGLGMEEGLFMLLAGRVSALPFTALPEPLKLLQEDSSQTYLHALAKQIPNASQTELAVDWAFFQAGLAQSLIIQGDAMNRKFLLARWLEFGIQGMGRTSSNHCQTEEKDDLQGFLFDF